MAPRWCFFLTLGVCATGIAVCLIIDAPVYAALLVATCIANTVAFWSASRWH